MRLKTIGLAFGLLAVQSLTVQSMVSAAPATTQADAASPTVHWPAGWEERKPSVSGITQYALNAESGAGADFSATPASDYADDISITQFATHRLDLLKGTAAFKKLNPVVGTVRPAHVGGYDAAIIDIQTVFNQVKSHYEYVYFKKGDSFCRLAIYSVPSKWPTVQPLIDSLVESVQ